ncbi:unnamed protein product [Prorocentrum cordatum]|uniref:Endonuclease/exonuclease/phosphatase domain-containing protein n=1 Tax=Prorocentrum cordatum TaxID=2364126 RepID=A0ABN9TXS5_9DINO|nr:unnamed protein product [Polarella glacialis]
MWSIWKAAAWLIALDVVVQDAFTQDSAMTKGVVDHAKLWTRGAPRRPHARSQVDVLCVSSGVSGEAFPRAMSGKLFSRSDHKPIVGNVEIQMQSKHYASKPRSLVGWKPESSENAADYQERCADLSGDDFTELQAAILSVGNDLLRGPPGDDSRTFPSTAL